MTIWAIKFAYLSTMGLEVNSTSMGTAHLAVENSHGPLLSVPADPGYLQT
jgi:hypothetical protein